MYIIINKSIYTYLIFIIQFHQRNFFILEHIPLKYTNDKFSKIFNTNMNNYNENDVK